MGLLVPPEVGAETVAHVRQNLGLNEPYYVQYALFLKSILTADLGTSFLARRPVMDLILERLPVSMILAVASMLLGVLLAFPLGILSALKRGRKIDSCIQIFGAFGIATPQFWIGLILIQIFAGHLGLLPVGGAESWRHFILPTCTLGLLQACSMLRILRSNMIEALGTDFVALARAKGLSEARVVGVHALGNAVLPVLTFGGLLLASLMTGTIVVESVFALPGLGRLAYDAALFRDYPLVQGVVIVAGVIIIAINLLIDVSYAFIDPRIQLDNS